MSCCKHWSVRCIGVFLESPSPPDIESPSKLQTISDNSVLLRLMSAIDVTVTHYYVVIVDDELAQKKTPLEFHIDEVIVY